MSARQNKRKRNPFHRERTVTTLLEDPNTHLLVPTPTEEPPRFSFHHPHPLHQEPLDPHQHPMPAQTHPQTHLHPPQTDLEVLQNLKDMIKAGQHEFYRAVPQPQALAAVYLGP
ncbi:hypothetical protein C8R47DRAFT_950974, partial [Mycena vitilis]